MLYLVNRIPVCIASLNCLNLREVNTKALKCVHVLWSIVLWAHAVIQLQKRVYTHWVSHC